MLKTVSGTNQSSGIHDCPAHNVKKASAMKAQINIALLMLIIATAHAGPRTSLNYTIATDTADASGKRATSANYTNDSSAGAVAGLSNVASLAETAKSGYIAQLCDIAGLVVNAASPSVNETATLQLAAWQLLDDTSLLAVPAASVAWSVTGGPITGISAAGTVYQNTVATVQGSFGGFTGSLNLTVLDSIPDNFGSYAGDGLDDAWQVQYFGLNNPNAAPGFISDGSGLTNRSKYIAGLVPGGSNLAVPDEHRPRERPADAEEHRLQPRGRRPHLHAEVQDGPERRDGDPGPRRELHHQWRGAHRDRPRRDGWDEVLPRRDH